jgi:hypothetical protein
MPVENIDYYFNEDGLMVITEKYHLQRGYCCGNGCHHCPYNFSAVPEPERSYLRKEKEKTKGST